MTYSVKEMFLTVQGEGAQAGRVAVFLRFSGCNLWSGREGDRSRAVCSFCDTDFVGADGPGGGKFKDAASLAEAVADCWTGAGGQKLVVCTGGEPILQLDPDLIRALKAREFKIAVETNGTLAAPAGLDWICVSPKGSAPYNKRMGTNSSWSTPSGTPCPSVSNTWPFGTSGCSPWMDLAAKRLRPGL